jgi:glutamate formiminotransferase
VLECVVNISEGADPAAVAAIAAAAGSALLDMHTDAHHNRSVLTLVGEDAPRAVTVEAVGRLDVRRHVGVHPRIGVVDVVPFVPLGDATLDDAVAARDRYCAWAARVLDLPCFAYGPERSLPDVRRGAFTTLAPTTGPDRPHPRAGAVAVGARPVLVAYNVWLAEPDLATARSVAAAVRGPHLRALGLQVGDRVQVSMNLIDPTELGPAAATDRVAALAPVAGCELVGLVPRAVLDAVPRARWAALDLAEDRTIEARLAR